MKCSPMYALITVKVNSFEVRSRLTEATSNSWLMYPRGYPRLVRNQFVSDRNYLYRESRTRHFQDTSLARDMTASYHVVR